MLRRTLLLMAGIAVAGAGYIRFAPVDPDRQWADPVSAADPGPRGALVRPPDAPGYPVSPAELFAELDRIILSTPRTTRLAQDENALSALYVTRSRLMGFPDTAALRVVQTEAGAAPSILARSVYGGYDWGTNAARLDAWLGALDSRLP